MNIHNIAFKNCKGLLVPKSKDIAAEASLQFITKMIRFGYMPDSDLADALTQCDTKTISSLEKQYMPLIQASVGGHVQHEPLFTDFPNNNTSDVNAYVNDMLMFLQTGTVNSNFNETTSRYTDNSYKMLGIVTNKDIDNVFTMLLESADSISDSNKNIIEWFIKSDRNLSIPDVIPFKENVCIVAGMFLEKDKWDDDLVKSTDDILRIVTYLSEGDISLASNTKFKNLPRKHRRTLVRSLEKVIKEEDLVRHSGKWVKLSHGLHVGDYSTKVYNIIKKVRENIKIETFDGKLQKAIDTDDWNTAINMLRTRPGMFARKIANLLTEPLPKEVEDNAFSALQVLKTVPSGRPSLDILLNFENVLSKVPTRNLTQLYGSLKTRDKEVNKRVIFPKGSVANAYVLRNKLPAIDPEYLVHLQNSIRYTFNERFKQLESLGKVWIDPALKECPLPTGMRSASEALNEVARGTRLPISDKNILRFFIYWTGQDLDLSASLHNENFELVETVSYYSYGDSDYAHYSGDVINAPNGGSEYIDIDIDIAKTKARYVVMNVHVYSGPTFAEHEECFAGWMTRDTLDNGEVYEPKSVQNKIDLRSDTKTAIPVIFDLKERKAIWADVNANGRTFGRVPNNVENNKASIKEMCEAFVSLNNKVSLYELFELHGKARGTIVENKDDADTVFSLTEGVTPFDIAEINSKFMV